MGRILAIDYGFRRVGIAVTDALKIIASPLATVAPEELIPYINKYLETEEVDQLVVGYPQKEDGSPTDLTAAVNDLVVKLKAVFPGLDLYTHDERYTSKMAKQSLLHSGARKKSRKIKANVDQISATLILQSFMEERKIAQ